MPDTKRPDMTAVAEAWDQAADAWAAWWPMIEAGAKPVSAEMLALAELVPGERVLDLASGIGEPAASAARVVGPEGRVVATDLSPRMVDLGRKRMAELGLGNVEFRQMDAEAPDLSPGQFDVVLARWGLMFVRDLIACLKGLHRLLVPSGRLALAVWAPLEDVPAISLAGRILDAELGFPPPEPHERTAFQLSDQNTLKADLRSAGFGDIQARPVNVAYTFDSPETYTTFRQEVSTINNKLEAFPPEAVAAAWDKVRAAAEAYRTADGTLRMDNTAICLTARKMG